jgi:seryl-tRNA synthetase|tara:strand:+ start:2390 stop:3658 length:1269 start_codon:yes stop_codon:yes gene_type:complete
LIDQKLFRDKPEIVRNMLKNRNVEIDISKLLQIDQQRRSIITELESFKMEKNKISSTISEKKKVNEDISNILIKMKEISTQIDKLTTQKNQIQEKYKNQLESIPNLIHDSVPIGKDENSNIEIEKWGKRKKLENTLDHIDLSIKNNLVDIERAGKISGSRFYFLKNQLVKLNYALISFALEFMNKKGYIMIQPPYLMNRKPMSGAVILSDFEEVIYKIEDQDLYLIGTSEHPLAAMHANEIFSTDELPLRYVSISPCFRKEAGSHGRDTKGIFRVHQFEKVEVFSITKPDESWDEHEKILSDVKEFYKELEIPYRIMLLSSGDMGKVAAKTYDIESWLPGQDNYREIVSCSNCTDYQARRLGIKFRHKPHEESLLVHTLNSTVTATERTLIAIIENYQNENGTITIPKVLQPYMNNKKEITP